MRGPNWLIEADRVSAGYHAELLELPIVQAAVKSTLSRRKMRRFMRQIGIALIEHFPVCLLILYERIRAMRPRRGTWLHGTMLWLRANFRQEQRHWRGWKVWARAYGLSAHDFADVRLLPACRAIRDHLERVCREAPVAVAIAALNYVVETGAAKVTKQVYPPLRRQLTRAQAWWLEVHAADGEGDEAHARMARGLLCALTKTPQLARKVKAVVRKTYALYAQALEDAYA